MRIPVCTYSFPIVAIALSSAKALQVTTPLKCANIEVDGYTYDLSPLNKEWNVEGRIPLKFNPCAPISYHNEACPKNKSYMCAMDPSSPSLGRANIGLPREVFRNAKNELVMMYSSGSFDMNGFPFVSLVRFECDPAATFETGPFEPIADGSKYFLVWRSKAACPKSGKALISSGMGFFSSIFSIIFIVLILYFVIGIAYNIVKHGKPLGWEALPHSHFWIDLWDFLKELIGNIARRLRGDAGGYQQI